MKNMKSIERAVSEQLNEIYEDLSDSISASERRKIVIEGATFCSIVKDYLSEGILVTISEGGGVRARPGIIHGSGDEFMALQRFSEVCMLAGISLESVCNAMIRPKGSSAQRTTKKITSK